MNFVIKFIYYLLGYNKSNIKKRKYDDCIDVENIIPTKRIRKLPNKYC